MEQAVAPRPTVCQAARPAQVVEMGVRQPDGSNMPVALLSFGSDDLPIPRRVYHHCLTSFYIRDQIGIRLDGAKHKSHDF